MFDKHQKVKIETKDIAKKVVFSLLLLTAPFSVQAKDNVAFICSGVESLGFVEQGSRIFSTKFRNPSPRLYLVYNEFTKPNDLVIKKELNSSTTFGDIKDQGPILVSKAAGSIMGTQYSTFIMYKDTLNYVKAHIGHWTLPGKPRSSSMERGQCKRGSDFAGFKSLKWSN